MKDIKAYNESLAEISKQIFPEHMRLKYVKLDDLREQELNARSMSKAMMTQLVENIENSGAPESLPLCATVEEEGDQIWIVSGHHRVRGSRAAGLEYLLIILVDGLSWDEIKAKQLAHNSIEGEDDPQMVKRIFEEIQSVEARFEAFIDSKLFDSAPDPIQFTQVDVDFKQMSRMVLLLFLPTQWDEMETALENILPKAEADQVILADYAEWAGWAEVLKKIRKDLDIVSVPTAIATMAALANERLEQIAEEGHDESA